MFTYANTHTHTSMYMYIHIYIYIYIYAYVNGESRGPASHTTARWECTCDRKLRKGWRQTCLQHHRREELQIATACTVAAICLCTASLQTGCAAWRLTEAIGSWLNHLIPDSPTGWHTAHYPPVFLWTWLTHLIPDSPNWWHAAHWMLQTDCWCQTSAKKDGGKRASEIGCRISFLPARLPQSIPKIRTHMQASKDCKALHHTTWKTLQVTWSIVSWDKHNCQPLHGNVCRPWNICESKCYLSWS